MQSLTSLEPTIRRFRPPTSFPRPSLGYLGTHEHVGSLSDVFIRRTSLAFRGLVTEDLLDQVAEALAPVLGWDASETAAQIGECRRVLTEDHGARPALSNA